MTNIEKARKHSLVAYEMKTKSAEFLVEKYGGLADQIKAIRADKYLTPEGKDIKVEALRKEQTKKFMKDVHLRKQKYIAELKKAQQAAEHVLHKPADKPTQEAASRFEKAFDKLKLEVSLAPDARHAKDRAVAFITQIDDPYFARIAQQRFNELSEPAIGMAAFNDARGIRAEFSKVYSSLENRVEASDAWKAEAVIEESQEKLANPEIFPPHDLFGDVSFAHNFIGANFEREALVYYQKPEEYFEKITKEEAPAYVDVDLQAEQAAVETPTPPVRDEAQERYAAFAAEMKAIKEKLTPQQQ